MSHSNSAKRNEGELDCFDVRLSSHLRRIYDEVAQGQVKDGFVSRAYLLLHIIQTLLQLGESMTGDSVGVLFTEHVNEFEYGNLQEAKVLDQQQNMLEETVKQIRGFESFIRDKLAPYKDPFSAITEHGSTDDSRASSQAGVHAYEYDDIQQDIADMLKTWPARGKEGEHKCPHGYNCRKGGLDDVELAIFGLPYEYKNHLVKHVPQPCPVPGCKAGPYYSLESLRIHIKRAHKMD